MQKAISRRLARETAFQYLFSTGRNTTDTSIVTVSKSDFIRFCENFGLAYDDFSWELIEGTLNNLERIDDEIKKFSTNWKPERMPKIDRTILRLCSFEILQRADIPKTVSINEALEMAKKFGEADSTSFINGILDKMNKTTEPSDDQTVDAVQLESATLSSIKNSTGETSLSL